MSSLPGTKRLAYLAIATGIAALAAGAVIVSDSLRFSRAPERPKFFDALGDRIAQARRVEIETADATIILELAAERGWLVANRGGFPANGRALRELLIGLAELEIEAPKTSNPKWHGALELVAPAAGGEALHVRVLGPEDVEIADLLIGKQAAAGVVSADGLRPRLYVRDPDEAQSWLAIGQLSPPREASDWMDLDILDIQRPDIQAVEIAPPAGSSWRARRDSADDLDFTLETIPAGRAPKSPSVANSVAFAPASLFFTDARPAAEIAAAPETRAVYTLFDGRVLRFEGRAFEDAKWLTISVEGDATDALAAKLDGWAFAVSDWNYEKFATPLSDLLAEEDGDGDGAE